MYQGGGAQLADALTRFLGQNMSPMRLITLEFTAGSGAEAFRSAAISLKFGHTRFLFSLGDDHHGNLPAFEAGSLFDRAMFGQVYEEALQHPLTEVSMDHFTSAKP